MNCLEPLFTSEVACITPPQIKQNKQTNKQNGTEQTKNQTKPNQTKPKQNKNKKLKNKKQTNKQTNKIINRPVCIFFQMHRPNVKFYHR